MNGLENTPLQPPGFFDRLFGRKLKANAFIEVRNLVATRPIRELSPRQVETILEAYSIPLDLARPPFEEIYAAVLAHLVRDGEITDQGIADLGHLKLALGLADASVEEIHRGLIEDAYRKELRKAVGDSWLTPDEKLRLREVAQRLRIAPAQAEVMRKEEVSKIFRRVFDAAIQDRRLSREEEAYLDELAKNLGVKVDHDQVTLRQLDHYRLLWRIGQGELPELAGEIPLESGERCHSQVWVRYYEHPEGAPTSVRMGKRVDWRLGHGVLDGRDPASLREGGEGPLIVTDRRILFGSSEARSAPLGDVARVVVFRDGIEVHSGENGSQLYGFAGDAEVIGAILEAALQSAQSSSTKGPEGA